MEEFTFISKITPKTYRQAPIIKGIGDDAAVLRLPGEDLVVAVDTFVEGVHFTDQTLSPEQLGYRVLAVNLSDMAAMGARPLAYLVSLVAKKGREEEFYYRMYAGMEALASRYRIDLIGGDTVVGEELVLSVTVLGSVPRDQARYRSQAKPGDIVFVTGSLGDAQAGLNLLLDEKTKKRKLTSWERTLIRRHQEPEPRVDFAQALRPIQRLALNDISDGIANELEEIATSSQVTIVIEAERLPVSLELQHFPRLQQEEWKLFGGEDFELVGTVAEEEFPKVKEIGRMQGLEVTAIGRVSSDRQGKGRVFLRKDGRERPLEKRGYIHRSEDSE